MATLTSMLASSWLGMPVAIWLGFVTFVALLVAVDLGIERLKNEALQVMAMGYRSRP